MTLSDLAIDRLLDPGYLVDECIPVVLHEGDGEAVLRIDDPNK